MKKNIISVLLILLGISITAYGAISGQSQGVLSKAVKICLECVGFGQ